MPLILEGSFQVHLLLAVIHLGQLYFHFIFGLTYGKYPQVSQGGILFHCYLSLLLYHETASQVVYYVELEVYTQYDFTGIHLALENCHSITI